MSLHFIHLFSRQLYPDHQRSHSATLDSQILIPWHCQFSCKVLQEARGGIYPSVCLSVRLPPCNSSVCCRLQDFLSNKRTKIYRGHYVADCGKLHYNSHRTKSNLQTKESSRWQLLAMDPTEHPVIGVKSWQTSGILPNEHLKEVYNSGDAVDEQTSRGRHRHLYPHHNVEWITRDNCGT